MEQQTQSGGHILLMDDEEIILKTTGILLRRLGYEVDTSRNGEEAIEMYRRSLDENTPYDVVIMDLSIPEGMGGREAVSHLREMNPDVRAIVTSGYFEDPIFLTPDRGGFSAVIAKPYRIEELGALVQDVIQGKP